MTQAMNRKQIKEARAILKPVLKAEKRLKKAANALLVAKLALAHALVEADVGRNAALSAWTDAVLSGDEVAAQHVCASLAGTKDKVTTKKPAAALKIIPGPTASAKPRAAPKVAPKAASKAATKTAPKVAAKVAAKVATKAAPRKAAPVRSKTGATPKPATPKPAPAKKVVSSPVTAQGSVDTKPAQ